MSLSNISRVFLFELHAALNAVEVDGSPFELSDRTLLIGNGGSAAIASHIANDMVKNGLGAFVPDSAILTCLANDLGWERVFDNWLFRTQVEGDGVIAISSSGRSQNIINGCRQATLRGRLITLTGFDADNPVRKMGHTNYWVPSHNYGVVECAHLAILHSLVRP